MSDLRPEGIEVELGGKKHRLLFTLSVIDGIQSRLGKGIFDAMDHIAEAAEGDMEHETLKAFCAIMAILLNGGETGPLTDNGVARLVTKDSYRPMAWAVMAAFGLSLPEPEEEDEEDEEEEGDEDGPKVPAGR